MSSTSQTTGSRPLLHISSLYPYQPHAIEKMVSLRRALVLLTMGLGKTVITLTALQRLGVRRVLVLAPASIVNADVWGDEARAWAHLKDILVVPVEGTPAQRERLVREGPFATLRLDVMSYENIDWFLDELDLDRYDAVVFDEVSKMKTPGAKRFKRLRSQVQKIPVRFGLTGTPVGNHLLDLWGEAFITVGEEPFGSSYIRYKQEYFVPLDYKQFTWGPQHGAEARILERLKPHAFSLDSKLAAGRLPEVRVNPVYVPLPPTVQKQMEDLARTCVLKLDDGVDLQVLSASAQAMKVRQLASGAVYTDPLDDTRWSNVHGAKVDRLKDMVEALSGEPVIVWYWFQHELARLKKALPHARELGRTSIEEWNKGKVEVLLLHPGSAGHGLNLQHGGFQSIWFTLPWSLEMWKQANGRLARPGQKAPYCIANVLLAGEVDSAVLGVLKAKAAVENKMLDGLALVTDISDLE